MKKIYIYFLAIPVLAFTLMWLSVWWFAGGVAAFMLFIAYQFYASRLEAVQARTEVLEKEMEDLNAHLESSVLKEQKTSKEADQLKRTKQQLLTVIGHEIRTPMNGVLGMALLLEDTSLTKEQQEYVNTIKSSGEILLTAVNNLLVNDIIDFSKLQQEGNQLEYKNFDLRDCIEEVLELFAKKAGDANLELIYQIDSDVPEQIIGDAKRLRQVLTNLLENAVKFTSKGEIFLTIHRNPSITPGYPPELTFQVKDTGIGMANDQLKVLFKGIPSKEARNGNQKESTGLGLIVGKKIVEMMGGNIEVKSRPGEGTSIGFSIPVTPSLKAIRDRARQNNLINLEGKRLLLVEDNRTSAAVLLHQLKLWKMIPVHTNSGNNVLDLLSKDVFDLVITDVTISGIDCVQLAKTNKEKYPSLPVIGMSYPFDDNLKQDFGIFSSMINKPVRVRLFRDHIIASLSQAMGNKQATLTEMSDEFAKQYPLRILVAEDNIVNQKIAVKILNKLGYQPALANHGKEAIEMAGQETYDIIQRII